MLTMAPAETDERADADAADLALVTAYQRGNGNALAELYRRHGRRVESVARNLTGPSSELEDVVQDVFIELQRALFSFRGEARFTTWLHRVTVNVTLMHLRRIAARAGCGGWGLTRPARQPRRISAPKAASKPETFASNYMTF